MKRIEKYQKTYSLSDIPGYCQVPIRDNKDRLVEELKRMCLHQFHKEGDYLGADKFLFCTKNGAVQITTDTERDKSSQRILAYTRKITLEIMPPDAKIPRELLKLLRKEEFFLE